MVVFPNCKINLGLNILQKREDGFHDLETFFFPLPWSDALEIISTQGKTSLATTGFTSGPNENNLCLKAYYLLKKDFHSITEIKILLHKVIPAGAGLGGGSADAAFALQLLNKKFNLAISERKLENYALQLGSDCPFFLINQPCVASGRGEILERIPLSLSGYKILLIYPGLHIGTAEAFNGIEPLIPKKRIKEIIQKHVELWREELGNDFEKNVFEKHPELKKIKSDLYEKGALYASMSGSGSTVFGIFLKDYTLKISLRPGYIYKEIIIP
jgi:4-diphosphocytidyl-2-C-methyl-D-erythritol kinase